MAARRRPAKLEGNLSPLATTLLWRMVPVGSLDSCVPFVMVDHDYLYAPPTRILAKGACVREVRLADVRRTIRGLGSGRLSAQAPVMTNGNTPGWHGFVKRLSQRLTELVSGAQEDAWFILLPEDRASANDPTVHHNGRRYRIRFVPAGTPGALSLDALTAEG